MGTDDAPDRTGAAPPADAAQRDRTDARTRVGTPSGGRAAVAAGPARAQYVERLWVPWTWWVLGIVGGGLLCLEVTTTLTVGDIWVGWQVITIAVVAGVLLAWLVSQSTARVAVVDGELVAGHAHLPVEYIGELRLVDDAARRRLMGPGADPTAYTYVRAWVRLAVLIEITDPDDPTPYWLVSTRHPTALAAALGR